MSEDLDEALPPDQLYDYRANSHIELCAPYQQGDTFRSDALGASSVDGGDSLVMLFMHPCTMRRAGALEKFVTVVRIKQESPRKLLRPDFWRHHYKVMPLPDLLGDGSSTHSADFMHISTIESSTLPRTERIAQLSTAGRLQMQQRLINHFTRYIVSTDLLLEATAHIEAEALYQADWVSAAVRARMCDGDNLADVEQSERQYQEYLGAERMGEPPLRDMLKTVETRPLATRLIQIEISERYPKPV